MMTQNATTFGIRIKTKTVESSEQAARSSWRRAAFGGAALCSLLAVAYTLAFMLYAMARSALTVTTTVNADAGMLGTLIATWASLFVAALVIGLLLTVAVAILGAVTGIIIRAALAVFHSQADPQRATVIGASIPFAIVVLLHLALRSVMSYSFPDLLSMHTLFWLEMPSLVFIVAGGWATRRFSTVRP